MEILYVLVGALATSTVFLVIDKYHGHKHETPQETEEERRERVKAEKHMANMMNYSAEKAVKHE